MAKKGLLTEKNKQILAGVFGVIFLFVFVYEFFLSDSGGSSPKPAVQTAPAASTAHPAPSAALGQNSNRASAPVAGTQEAQQLALERLLADTTPLDLAAIRSIKEGGKTERDNMFETHKDPPPPPPPPPAPPPIAIRMLDPQTAIAGTPKDITLKVTGASFPPDAQVIFGGTPKETHRLSETVLSVEISAAEYSSQRSAGVEVKSKSDPVKQYSNQIPFIIQPSPLPPFKNVGRIADLAVIETGDGTNKQYRRVRRGQTIESVWRVDAVTDTGVDVTDTRYNIKKHVPLEEKDKK
jgi:hypothetical protein